MICLQYIQVASEDFHNAQPVCELVLLTHAIKMAFCET
jgi:hypothetical protein